MKTCRTCKRDLPTTDFQPHNSTRDRLTPSCRECRNARRRALRDQAVARDPEQVRQQERAKYRASSVTGARQRHKRRATLAKYGLDEAGYEKLLTASGGTCYVCGALPGAKALAVDHDHACCDGIYSCGSCIRGLLCFSCNTALGAADDSASRLRALADYLERS